MVDQQVQRRVGGLDPDGPEQVRPPFAPQRPGRLGVRAAQPCGKPQRLLPGRPLAQQERHFLDPAGRQVEVDLQRRARVVADAGGPRQADPRQAWRGRGAARASQELGPIGRPAVHRTIAGQERDRRRPVGVERVLGQQRLRAGVVRGRQPVCGAVAVDAQHPFGVVGHGEPPRPPGEIGHAQGHGLRGGVRPGERTHPLLQPVGRVLVGRVAGPVPDHVRHRRPRGPRGRRPDRAGLLVAEVDRLRRQVGQRIVAPGRQPVLAAVARPGRPETRLGAQEPSGFGRDYIAPRRGGRLPGHRPDHVRPVLAEAAQSVVEGQFADAHSGRRWRGGVRLGRLGRSFRVEGRKGRRGLRQSGEPVGEAARAAREDDLRRPVQCRQSGPVELVGAHQEDAPADVQRQLGAPAPDEPLDGSAQAFGVAGRLFVDQRQVNLDPPPPPPVAVGAQEVLDQR